MTTPTNVRFIEGMPMPEYQRRPELSASDLKAIGRDPAGWKWDKEHPTYPTEAMILGSAVHAYTLEPGREGVATLNTSDASYDIAYREGVTAETSNGVVETPFTDWRTLEARMLRTSVLDAGGYPLRAQDVARAKTMAVSLRAHPRIGRILTTGTPEVSFFGIEGFTALRGRLDWIDPGSRTILDIKTADSVHPDDFARSAYDHGYHLSAGHYLDYVAAAYDDAPQDWTYVWGVVAKHPPYEAIDAEPTEDMLHLGRIQKDRAIWRYQHCTETGVWGFGSHTHPIDAPPWARKREGLE